jgi:putative tricarboxylic transport membrane protein
MFIAFGALAMFISRDYPFGSAMRMGPGYFPTVLGGMLVVAGAVISATGFKVEGEAIKPFAWKPIIFLSVAFSVFGWGMDHLGFVPSMIALIMLCAAAGREFKWTEVIIMTIVLIIGSWALFIWGLDLPYPLYWER